MNILNEDNVGKCQNCKYYQWLRFALVRMTVVVVLVVTPMVPVIIELFYITEN